MKLKNLILRNKHVNKFINKQATRFLIRPYVQLRRIPIIAIIGTNGKTTITRLLHRIYLLAGYRVGMCCTEEVYSNGKMVAKGDYSFGHGILKAIRRQKIDIVVAETARGGILKYGLGFYACQVGVVTNVYEDHFGLDGVHTLEQMAEVKSTIVINTAPNGSAVLNGDDALVRSMSNLTRNSVIYFTVEGRQDKFNHCYYLKDGWIFRKYGSNSEPIIDVKTIPITLQGELTYNIANIMAVLAVVEGMQTKVPVSIETVRAVLQEFGKNPNDNPIRFTFLRFKERFVLFCTCKNPESFRRDVEIIRKIQKEYKLDHVIGILSAVGNRNQDYYNKISSIVAPICRYFFIHPPAWKYLRNRAGEEIVRLLSANIPKNHILNTENLSLESVFDQTEQVVNGNCLYVHFDADLEADWDVPRLIREGQTISIEIDGRRSC